MIEIESRVFLLVLDISIHFIRSTALLVFHSALPGTRLEGVDHPQALEHISSNLLDALNDNRVLPVDSLQTELGVLVVDQPGLDQAAGDRVGDRDRLVSSGQSTVDVVTRFRVDEATADGVGERDVSVEQRVEHFRNGVRVHL